MKKAGLIKISPCQSSNMSIFDNWAHLPIHSQEHVDFEWVTKYGMWSKSFKLEGKTSKSFSFLCFSPLCFLERWRSKLSSERKECRGGGIAWDHPFWKICSFFWSKRISACNRTAVNKASTAVEKRKREKNVACQFLIRRGLTKSQLVQLRLHGHSSCHLAIPWKVRATF